MLDLHRIADAYQALADENTGLPAQAAQNAADKIRTAAAAAAEADRKVDEQVNDYVALAAA